MLSKEEKKEMISDAKDMPRKRFFQVRRGNKMPKISLDGYISFLDSVQKIFSPFKISTKPTLTKFNKL